MLAKHRGRKHKGGESPVLHKMKWRKIGETLVCAWGQRPQADQSSPELRGSDVFGTTGGGGKHEKAVWKTKDESPVDLWCFVDWWQEGCCGDSPLEGVGLHKVEPRGKHSPPLNNIPEFP
jgi:hypothetical protein